jgi:glycosyltransferase involved in cell wall biosynthesis
MKLLIAADIFPPESGGPATYAVTLANELVNLGDEVVIVSLNPKSDRSAVSCPLFPVRFKNKLLRYAHYFWLLYQNAKNVDVIYAMGPVNAGVPALAVAKILRKKFIVKVVGDYAWEQGQVSGKVNDSIDAFQNKSYPGKIGWLKRKEAEVVGAADAIIAPSKYLKNIVIGWGASEKRVHVIYNEVAFETPEPIVHSGEHWIVSVGRLVPWKGMEMLVEIMPEILKNVSDAKLKIVGNGPEFDNLKLKIKNLQLGNLVELTDNLSHAKTLKYIASADIFILNSAYEGFSHVLIEAHHQGVPVIASRAGGNTEILEGDSLFEYNNKQEIVEKICRFIYQEKYKKVQGRFHTDLIPDTKALLERVCAN